MKGEGLVGVGDSLHESENIIKSLRTNLKKITTALKDWDVNSLVKTTARVDDTLNLLNETWKETEEELLQEKENLDRQIQNDDYQNKLERALDEQNIPWQGKFPNYEFIPFKLAIDLNEGVTRLSIGRKNEKISALSPERVVARAAKRYKSFISGNFNYKQFCKELIKAYSIGNKLALGGNDVRWGHPVSLKTIYELLTLTQSSKRAYPKELFIYDLGRLKEQVNLKYQCFSFELGFARNQANSLLIVDSKGRENRVSSLIIHKDEEEAYGESF